MVRISETRSSQEWDMSSMHSSMNCTALACSGEESSPTTVQVDLTQQLLDGEQQRTDGGVVLGHLR